MAERPEVSPQNLDMKPEIFRVGTVRAGVKTFFAFLLTAGLCLFAPAAARAQSFSIDWFTIDGGGPAGAGSTGGVFTVTGIPL